MNRQRIISGVVPTGMLHLGNYLGTMRSWPSYQDQGQSFYFVGDLHALNTRPEAKDLERQTWEIAAWLLALGIDPQRSVVFIESQVPAHAELMTILNNYVTMGELERMTQYKDKSQKFGPDGQVAGLFEYPVLMTADILLYDINLVPVGEDQKQHLEITRDIATRFNNRHGDVFTLPEPFIQKVGARIMDLQRPERKMSKSDGDKAGCILLTDSAVVIEQKIMRAVTDSGSVVEATDAKPALTNLLQIMSLVTGRTMEQLQREYAGKGYGDFKRELARALVDELMPLQNRFQDLLDDRSTVERALQDGRTVVGELAERKLVQVKQAIGLIGV